MLDMQERCTAEIEELHDFFTAWFRGELPADDESFARFASAMHEGFEIVSPDGTTLAREAILQAVRGGHGANPDVSITIRNPRLLHHRGELALMAYEECQTTANTTLSRLSTALFIDAAGTPNGVQWLHLHETWMEE